MRAAEFPITELPDYKIAKFSSPGSQNSGALA
jgi:hypothetical protein